MELSKEDYDKWIAPMVIDDEAAATRLVDAMDRASAVKHKEIDIGYKEITDEDEIKEVFGVEPVECWETSCLYNSACDAYYAIGTNYPYCCNKKCPCPNRIRDAF